MAFSSRRVHLRRVMTSQHRRRSDVLLVDFPTRIVPWHAVFAFLNPLLVAVLQVYCQASKLSPFSTHKANLWTFLSSTFIYCFVLAYYLKYRRHCRRQRYCKFVAHVALVTGSLGSVSIISIFLPHLLGRLIFIIWSFLPIYVSHKLIMNVGKRLSQALKNAAQQDFGIWKRITGNKITAQQRQCSV